MYTKAFADTIVSSTQRRTSMSLDDLWYLRSEVSRHDVFTRPFRDVQVT